MEQTDSIRHYGARLRRYAAMAFLGAAVLSMLYIVPAFADAPHTRGTHSIISAPR